MKKNIINLVLLASIFVFSISLFTSVSALTAADIDMLLKAGIITASQANVLNQSISIPNTTQVTEADYLNNNCANITADINFAQRDTTANGSAVSILQNFLNRNGYLSSTPTGYFGSMTLSAVKALQSANGINSTGYVGPLTRAKIKNLDCNVGVSQTTPISIVSNPVILATYPIANKPDSVAPSIILSAKPTQVMAGDATTLTWSSTNAVDQCKITSKDSLGKSYSSTIDASNVKSSGPINKPTTFTIVCYNKYGIPGSKSISVDIIDPNKMTVQPTNYVRATVISSVSPSSGNRGDIVTIKGSSFLSTNNVYFDGTKIDSGLISSQSSTSISFKIPDYKACLSASCLLPTTDTAVETGGQKIIQVSNTNGFSNDFSFILPSKIIVIPGASAFVPYTPPKPVISSISPTSGNRGDTVTISGSGFSSDSIVFFGVFKVADNLVSLKNSSSILFTVPPYQLGCTDPTLEVCPRLPLPGTGLIIETGGNKNIYVMNTSSKATSTSVTFTLPSKKIAY